MLKTAVIGKTANGTTQLSRIMIMSGDRIVLVDATTGQPPKKVITKMVSKDLHIFAEGATEPSVILNDYASFDQTVQISGIDPSGAYVNYGAAEAGSMELGAVSATTAATSVPILSTSAIWGIGILAVAGGVALAAGGGGSGDSSTSTATTTPTTSTTLDTTASAPVIAVVATDDIVNLSENASLLISGTGEIGATVTLAATGQTAVVNSSGSWSIIVSDAALSFGQGPETLSVTQMDVAGNTSIAGTRAISVDTIIPTVTIADNKTTATNGLVTFTFTFSENVYGFTADDITIGGGMKGTFSGSGSVYTLEVTPNAASTADITVDIAATVMTDLSGNANAVVATYSQAVDTVAPTFLDGTANAGSDMITLNFDSVLDTVDFSSIGNFILTVANVDHSDALYALSTSGSSVNIFLDTSKYNIDMGDTVKISYSDTSGDAVQAIQDLAGNDVISFGNTTLSMSNVDTPPVLTAMAPNSTNEQIVLTFNEALNASNSLFPALADFGIEINGAPVANPTGVTITGTQVTLQLGTNITLNDLVKVTYTDNVSTINAIQDLVGNDASSFTYTNTAVI